MDFWTLIKRYGLNGLVITAIIGAYTFFIRAEYKSDDQEEMMKELKAELRDFKKDIQKYIRIADDLRYELFTLRMQKEDVARDTTGMNIDLNK